jgi:hypothetical protein
MGRTEQRLLVAGSIAFLLAVSAATGAAATDARAATLERVSSASPTAFAERITAGDAHSAASRDSWQTAIELIVLVATCFMMFSRLKSLPHCLRTCVIAWAAV